MTQERQIAVLGAGLMGAQIGVEFALHGFEVHFLEVDPVQGDARIKRTLERASELGIASAGEVEAAAARVELVSNQSDLPATLPMVIECLPESLELKVSVLRSVAMQATAAVLASNTSSLRIEALGEGTGSPERTVGLHYWNPPLLMPLVEVTSGPRTDPMVVELVTRTVESVGKVVVPVQRDVPGFVWNRLQMAFLREAMWLLDNGVTTIDGIEKVAALGLARRWRHAGFFGSIFAGGPQTWEVVAANLFPTLSVAQGAPGLARRLESEADRWTSLVQQRDEGLARDPWQRISHTAPTHSAGPDPRGDDHEVV